MWGREIASVRVTVGGAVVTGLWLAVGGFVIAMWLTGNNKLGITGIAVSALAASVCVIHDNQRTRHLVRGATKVRSLP